EDGIRDATVTGVQTCALPISRAREGGPRGPGPHGAGGVSLLAHTRVGAGPRPVFLLHGFLGSARNLATLARGLAQRRPDARVIALDLTGHGESPPLPPRPDVDVIARDVHDTDPDLSTAASCLLPRHTPGVRVTQAQTPLLP